MNNKWRPTANIDLFFIWCRCFLLCCTFDLIGWTRNSKQIRSDLLLLQDERNTRNGLFLQFCYPPLLNLQQDSDSWYLHHRHCSFFQILPVSSFFLQSKDVSLDKCIKLWSCNKKHIFWSCVQKITCNRSNLLRKLMYSIFRLKKYVKEIKNVEKVW